MLEEPLMALAAAGGTAVVQAAGTDAWTELRGRIARLFGRGDVGREQAELARLDRSADELARSDDADTLERVRLRQVTVWQTRIEDLLEQLDPDERGMAAARLRALLSDVGPGSPSSDGTGGVAAGRDMTIRADRNSLAAGLAHIDGGVHLGNPPQPGPDRP
jgi:hypothetical protein